MNTTLDGLLDRRVTLEQPAEGYRVAVDTVLLAAAVPARTGERVLDLGCGVGGTMLCLACRVPGLAISGIEIQTELAQLCEANIARNRFDAKLDVRCADIMHLPAEFHAAFDHVLMNPPYHDEARHDVSDHAQKRTANTEKAGALGRWIDSAAQALKPGGMLTLIHRSDRLQEILTLLAPSFGGIEVMPVLPKVNAPAAKRVLVRARKGASAPLTYCQPLILHEASGPYTEAAESILRHMKSAAFVP